MSNLSAEEFAALFPEAVAPAPETAPAVAAPPSVPMSVQIPDSVAVLPPDAPASSASTEAPAKATKAKKLEIMPQCVDCNSDLTPDNASKKRGGGWKHVGCPGKVCPTPGPMLLDTKDAGGNLTTKGPALALGAPIVDSTATPVALVEGARPVLNADPLKFVTETIRGTVSGNVTVIEFGPESKALIVQLIKALDTSGELDRQGH